MTNQTIRVPNPRPIPPETKITYMPGDPAPRVSSRTLAEAFGKKHQHVLREIKELRRLCPYEFNQSNFGQIEYHDALGRKQPEYLLSRDGFSLVAMGFTGAKALKFKLAYIEAFNAMEAKLAAQPLLAAPAAKEMLDLTPLRQERLKKVIRYRERGFTRPEIAAVMKLHLRSVSQLITDARRFGLLDSPVPAMLAYTKEA